MGISKRKVNKYLQSFLTYSIYMRRIEQINSRRFSVYLKGYLAKKQYETRQRAYQRKIMLALAHSIAKKKQLRRFCSELLSKWRTISLIQQQCREFVETRRLHRKGFEKYFTTMVTLRSYQKSKK
jgi:hypothetical protein